MRSLTIVMVGVCFSLASVPAVAGQPEDEAAIREATKQFFAAENKQDTKALAALVAADYEDWTGLQKGREAYERRMEGIFAHQTDIQVKMLDEIGVVFITPDVAIHKFRFSSANWPDADGKPQTLSEGLQARLYVRQDGMWLLAVAFRR